MKKETIQTIIIVIACLLFCFAGKAQVYGGMGISTHSAVTINFGYLSQLPVKHKAQISGGLILPVTDNVIPKKVYLQLGGEVFSNDNGYYITPSIGFAHSWLSDKVKIDNVTGLHMLYSLECGRTIYTGRLFGRCDYTNNITFLSIGLKAFIK